VAGGDRALADAPFYRQSEQKKEAKKEAGVWCTTAS
jgi:hypothetical protein